MKTFPAACLAALALAVGFVPAARADDPPPPTKKELADAQARMKRLILAFHDHAAAHDYILPNNLYGRNNKPLLSWRVMILPFLGEPELYKEFTLDEPWDSERNKKLIARMPKVYAPIRGKAKEGETFYRVFTGTGLFGVGAKYKVGDIPDGTSNTGFVFEAGEPVAWTQPDELAYDPKKPLPKLGGMFDGVCHVGLGDGSVLRMWKDPDEVSLRYLIEPDDGINVDLDKLLVK